MWILIVFLFDRSVSQAAGLNITPSWCSGVVALHRLYWRWCGHWRWWRDEITSRPTGFCCDHGDYYRAVSKLKRGYYTSFFIVFCPITSASWWLGKAFVATPNFGSLLVLVGSLLPRICLLATCSSLGSCKIPDVTGNVTGQVWQRFKV